jgi:hypothetical protein
MTIPDPDKDILDKLDRREARRKVILPGLLAVAGGFVAGLTAYEIMKLVFKLAAPAPLYGALVAFIGVSISMFARSTGDDR